MTNKKYKILLVEDDEFIARAYKDGFEQAGFEIIIAIDGADAINKIESEKPNLVLLDLIMPIKNGFEVLEDVKKRKWKLPIIILTNLGQEQDVQKATELGAVDYLIKANYSMRDVIRKVKEHLK